MNGHAPALAAALSMLPQQKQEEIFLYYFQHCTQKEIGKQYGQTRSTAGRHIRLALYQIRWEMEVTSHIYGHFNVDMEDYIKTKLIESQFKFRLDR